MGQRLDLHERICEAVGKLGQWKWDPFNFEIGDLSDDEVRLAIAQEAPKHVYYQPPASVKLSYPCVVYRLEDMPAIFANNNPYILHHVYQLTVIDRDPESELREIIAELPTCAFQRAFVADNLHHFIFRIYD